jgi:hypothetical protein
MRRRTMKEIMKEIDREIEEVYNMKMGALNNQHWRDFERASERLNSLFYCLHLLKGNEAILRCYQTNADGIMRNSGGFTLRGD